MEIKRTLWGPTFQTILSRYTFYVCAFIYYTFELILGVFQHFGSPLTRYCNKPTKEITLIFPRILSIFLNFFNKITKDHYFPGLESSHFSISSGHHVYVLRMSSICSFRALQIVTYLGKLFPVISGKEISLSFPSTGILWTIRYLRQNSGSHETTASSVQFMASFYWLCFANGLNQYAAGIINYFLPSSCASSRAQVKQ